MINIFWAIQAFNFLKFCYFSIAFCLIEYTGCFILSDMVNYLANRWFYWKIFQTKVAWLEERHMKCELDFESKSRQDHYCFFLNGNPYFLLYILEAYLESFPKHYNKITFHWVMTFRVMELEIYTAGVIHVHMHVWAEFLRARVTYLYLFTLLNIRSRARNWVQSFPIEQFNFPLFFYSFIFQFYYISRLFQSFFQNGRLHFKCNRWYYSCAWWWSWTKLL